VVLAVVDRLGVRAKVVTAAVVAREAIGLAEIGLAATVAVVLAATAAATVHRKWTSTS
jgi:hypothetical protein